MQPRKVKNNKNNLSLVGPLFSKQVWGPLGSIPCSPLSVGLPAHFIAFHNMFFVLNNEQ